MSEAYEVIVVGAGPGGIAAATVAAETGCRVCLIDDNVAPGGQIWRGMLRQPKGKAAHSASYWHWTERLRRTDCTILSGWQVIARAGESALQIECAGISRTLHYDKLILATGARERYLPFPGWTLPGVLGAGGVQAFCKAGFTPTGRQAVVAGTGPLLFPVAAGLAKHGARVLGIYEQAPLTSVMTLAPTLLFHSSKLVEGAVYRSQTLSAAYRTGTWVVKAEGADKLEAVVLTDGRKQWTVPCDLLAVGYHLVPNLELPLLMGCEVQDGFVSANSLQESSQKHVYCVGELTGIGGLDKAIVEGSIAALSAVGRSDKAFSLQDRQKKYQRFARQLEKSFGLRPELKQMATDDTIVCRCEDIRYGEFPKSKDWKAAKLETRCGMGACQGRICGPSIEFLFGWKRESVRPPLFPVSVGAIAHPDSGSETTSR